MLDVFWPKIRRRDYQGAPPRFGATEPPPSLAPSPEALLLRHRICLLIEGGLAAHRDRLDPDYWRQVEAELWMCDPGVPGLVPFLTQLMASTRLIAVEHRGSHDVWNVMEAAGFQAWAIELVEAVEQYRRHCEAPGVPAGARASARPAS